MGIVSVIPLRSGSKGLPGKNIKKLNGKRLCDYAIEQALRISDRVIISTDIDEVLNSSFPERCFIDERPSCLRGDNVSMSSVLIDLCKRYSLNSELIVLLQATSPLRVDSDIRDAIEVYINSDCDLAMSVVERQSSILKYGFVDCGKFIPISKSSYCFMNRQMLPKVYAPNGAVYVFRAGWFVNNLGFTTDNICSVIMPDSRSYDIDTLADFIMIENVMKNEVRGGEA